MMPEMNGMDAAKHLRGLDYTGPIVALTANAMVGQAEIFLTSGFDAFLSKPIDTHQLDSVLNQLIRDKQPPEVIKEARAQQFAAKKTSSA
jgi:CheY-like chemotaxis protein